MKKSRALSAALAAALTLGLALPAGAASWTAQYGLDGLRASGTLALPAVAQACLTCAASGLAFAVIFLPLSYRLAPGILEPVWRRLRRGRPQGQA